MSTESILKKGRAEMFLRMAVIIMVLIALFGVVSLASAEGSMRISGIGFADDFTACPIPEWMEGPEGQDPDFANIMTGDLKGCLYVFVDYDSIRETPSGTYYERGTEIYVGSGEEGDEGTFETTYVFTAKFTEDGQKFGRCQHPIVAGSGSGDFEGATGRIDFKDDIEAGNFPYTGNLKTS